MVAKIAGTVRELFPGWDGVVFVVLLGWFGAGWGLTTVLEASKI